MSAWKDEADFLHDVESISEFFIPGEHNNPANKFVFKSNKKKTQTSTAWYEESDSDDSVDYSFGRGRKKTGSIKNPGEEPNHLDVMREIQMQVRSAVGNRYNNDAIESYYNVSNDLPTCESPTSAPKEVSITYAKEQNSQKGSPVKQSSRNESPVNKNNISQAVAKLNLNGQVSSVSSASSNSSAASSPKRGKHNNRRKFGNKSNYRTGIGRGQRESEASFPFGPSKSDTVNVSSKDEFPPL